MSGQVMVTKDGVEVKEGDTVWDCRAVKCVIEAEARRYPPWYFATPEDGHRGSKIEDVYVSELAAIDYAQDRVIEQFKALAAEEASLRKRAHDLILQQVPVTRTARLGSDE